MATLVFVEGLWRTGKSHLVQHLKKIQGEKQTFLVHDNLKSFRSVRHAPYLIYPSLFQEDQVFDGSPIGLTALSDPTLGIYKYSEVDGRYWDTFFRDWLEVLKQTGHRVIVIYFRPFSGGEQLVFSGIQKYLMESAKGDLMVDVTRCSLRTLTDLHDSYSRIILKMKQELRRGMEHYDCEYQEMDEALDALRHEGFLIGTNSTTQ